MSNNVAIGEGTVIHSRTTIRGPAIIGDHCEIGSNTLINPYTNIGDHTTIRNTETENTSSKPLHCGRPITGHPPD